MKVIGKISILGLRYTLCCASVGEDKTLRSSEGYCDSEACRIVIRDDIPSRDRISDVLTHEILHAIFEASGVSQELKDGDVEERIVRMLTPAIRMTFSQIPKVLK